MEENKNEARRQDEVFSKAVRAGKRTYFFDVKTARSDDHYLTITESKKRFNSDSGKFYYEKHKIFLYKEDFEKFADNLAVCTQKINELNIGQQSDGNAADNGKMPESKTVDGKANDFTDVQFDDLGENDSEKK